ncbi:GIN domain-containing protein [Parvularcula maris]|uniref:DUF2807 domain-containing protein n=1 Tax=Parvularcula maris TaxID=2965077 RepID=A0A9X2L6P4_9PROT|nr:DUF2807 domain-containing protein [Parvularcula maris]MCQ8184040.1 DUF2807 domain-containing protein [Parvularcula maris]
MLKLLTGLLAATAMTGAAHAQSPSIEIEDFYGTIVLELHSSGPVTAIKSGPGADEVEIRGTNRVRIDGGDEIDRKDWWKEYQRERKGFGNRGWNDTDKADRTLEKMLEDRPTLTITAPEGTDITIGGSAFKLTTEGDAGSVTITNNIHLWARLNDAEEADVSVHGSGYLKMGDIARMLGASVHGSGDIIAGAAQSAELSVHGSGDLEMDGVRERLRASVHGSGDLNVKEVGGSAKANVHGSGDIELGSVAGGFDGKVHGSGDLKVREVAGRVDAGIHGSGDLDIDGGEADELTVSVHGSGEFTFRGTAKTAKLRSWGSGEIEVAEVSGRVEAKGKNIRVDGQRIGRDSD